MRQLIALESAVVLREPAFWTAAAAHALMLAIFLLLWGGGVPAMAGDLSQQIFAVDAILLSLLAPWVAARCGAMSGLAVVVTAATLARTPSRVLLAKGLARALALPLLAVSGLPFLLLGQQMAAAPLENGLMPLLLLAAIVVFASVAVAALIALRQGRLTAWLVAAATLVGVLLLAQTTGAAALCLATGAVVALLVTTTVADSTLRYLPRESEAHV